MQKSAVDNIKRKENLKYILILEGVLIGLITGAVVSLFRLALIGADALRGRMVTAAQSSTTGAILLAGILLVITIAISWLLAFEPDIAGSGIPQVEAEMRGQKDMCWYKVLFAKIAGCALAIGGGLALGREGPSIQLGSMVGKGVSRAGHRLLTEERLLITCGAGAGLSAAFGAPLAGALFSLEELHKNFSAEVLLSTMAASAASDFVAANIFGLTPVFGFEINHGLPLKHYGSVILVGIAVGFFGILYNKTIAFMQDLFDKLGSLFAKMCAAVSGRTAFNLDDGKLSPFGLACARTGKLLIMFILAYVLAFAYPEALGSGSHLVGEISRGEFTLGALVVLMLVKFVFSTGSFGSGSPGGIFLPLLVLGAVTGGLLCRIMGIFGFNQEYITALVVIAMAGYFAAIVRAPVTGVVLITEMTGDFTCLLPLVLVSLVGYVIPEYFGVEPIYTQLMHRSQKVQAHASTVVQGSAAGEAGVDGVRIDRTGTGAAGMAGVDGVRGGGSGSRTIAEPKENDFGRQHKNRDSHSVHSASRLLLRDRKAVIDADVHVGSFMDGRGVAEFGLPLGTLIVSVLRDGVEIIPDGHTILRGGDELEILLREKDIADVENILDEKCKSVNEL